MQRDTYQQYILQQTRGPLQRDSAQKTLIGMQQSQPRREEQSGSPNTENGTKNCALSVDFFVDHSSAAERSSSRSSTELRAMATQLEDLKIEVAEGKKLLDEKQKESEGSRGEQHIETPSTALTAELHHLNSTLGRSMCVLEETAEILKQEAKARDPHNLSASYIHKDAEWVNLLLDGQLFGTTRSTLIADPNSLLHAMFSPQHEEMLQRDMSHPAKPYVLDRNPKYFEPILNYLRTGELIIDSGVNPRGVLLEATYYNLRDVMDKLKDVAQQDFRPPTVQIDVGAPTLTRAELLKILCNTVSGSSVRLQAISLRGVDCSCLDFSGVNLRRANLEGADMHGCTLSAADLTEANLSGTNLSSCNMQGCTLRGGKLPDCTLSSSYCEGADFSYCVMTCASLRNADFTHTNLEHADLTKADLTGTILRGAKLAHTVLDGVDRSGTNLSMGGLITTT
eukprot:TRINITY_DN68016_c3_g6_i6.p1 TRINITY_DN68016_c3_g6~~TRINITY_DN68016_c3_g6_i6.p1  ORF type:complete len:453 (-),score=29.24 TRINITY_DN68016_c3_g6_i6:548-1906(-)